MESSKHNDELIKRKLADLSIEPRKLKFAEVHANYEKARKASANRWGLYFIIGSVGIAALIGTYLFITPKTTDQLAQNTVASEYSASQDPSNGKANTIRSVGTNSEDRSIEHSDKTTSGKNELNNADAASNSSNEVSAKNIEATMEVKKTSEDNINASSSNNTTKNIENNSTNSTNKKERNTSKSVNSKKTNSTSNSSANKKTKDTDNSDQSNTNTAVAKKQSGNNPVIKGNAGTERKADLGNPISNKKSRSAADQKKIDDAIHTIVSSDPKSNGSDNAIVTDQTPSNNTTGSDEATNSLQGSDTQNTVAGAETKNELAKVDSVSEKNETVAKVDTAGSHIPGVIGTGSVSPRNKHKFLIGAEVSYSTLFYNSKENPNAPSQFSTGDPAFTTAYANAVDKGKYSFFNGSASLGYLYNEQIGITAGISYFSLKNKFDVQPASTPVYTTVVDHYVWATVTNTNVSPPTLSYMIVDTVYKQVQTANSNSVNATVNGDPANTGDYTNKITYLSIPINLSYVFKIGAKFSVEPQAGVIYTMPLKSRHLVATDAYAFDHSKQKNDLKRNLYFNTALKLGYNISNKMQVYVRQGYFFRNQSIYNADQPISLSIKSIYTSFGITYRIK